MSVFKKHIILYGFDHPRPRIVSGYIQNHIIIQPVILKLAEVSETMACVVVHRPLVAALYASPQYYSFYGDGFQLAHYKPEQDIAQPLALPIISNRGGKSTVSHRVGCYSIRLQPKTIMFQKPYFDHRIGNNF